MHTPRPARRARLGVLAACLLPLAAVPTASAAVVDWVGTSSFWDLVANWSPGLPAGGDDVRIDVAGTHTVTVRVNGGPFSVNSITMTGDELLSITTGTLTLAGLATADNPAGTSVLNRFTQAGGTLGGAGALVVTGNATLAGVQTGSGHTTLQGATAMGNLHLDAGRMLRNEGTVTMTGSMNLNLTDTAGTGRVDNAGTFDVRTFNHGIVAGNFGSDPGSAARFDNSGTFRKSTGAGAYGVAVAFHNLAQGTVDVLAGSFSFSGGGSNAGTNTMATGATMTLSGGTHAVGAGASFTGAGTLALTGAATVLDLLAPTTVHSRFTMSGGTVRGEDLTLNGPVVIGISSSLGVMSGAATTRLTGASTVGGGVNNPFGLDAGRVLRNEGAMVINGVLDLNRLNATGAGRIVNAAGATIDVQTFNQSIHATDHSATNPLDNGTDALIDNAGTFRKSTVGNYSIFVRFENTGVVDVTAGSLTFFGGLTNAGTLRVGAGTTLTLGAPGFVNTGTIAGHGTVVASGGALLNQGLVAPGTSTGQLSFTGALTLDDAGVVAIELAGPANADLLAVSGDAVLGGALVVTRLDGYAPAVGDSFVVMTFGGRAGTLFDSVSFAGFGAGVSFDVLYHDHDVTLSVAAVPAPHAAWLGGMGLVMLACRVRRSRRT